MRDDDTVVVAREFQVFLIGSAKKPGVSGSGEIQTTMAQRFRQKQMHVFVEVQLRGRSP